MATRLTGFSKLVITLLILAAIFFGGRYLLDSTKFGQDVKRKQSKRHPKMAVVHLHLLRVQEVQLLLVKEILIH
ncbi:MAG: hypothetical protein IPP49_14495 [Saprospiraceae bacterium]|nr:hypothetical protein [Saprospiraceae bacterium]